MRQRDVQLGILQDLQKELDDWNEKVRLTELDKINREHELALLRDETAAKKAECDRYNHLFFLVSVKLYISSRIYKEYTISNATGFKA